MHTKTGLQYFPFDVDFFNDDKIQLLSAEFQTRGEAIVIRLLCKIYANSYYYTCGDDEMALLARSIGDGTKPAEVKDVIHTALARRIFNQDLYLKYGILTSAGVQKRYMEATGRRKKVEVIQEYWLLDKNNLPPNFTTKPLENANISPPKCIHPEPKMYTSSELDVNKTNENVDMMSTSCIHPDPVDDQNVNISKQSKVKESKVNKKVKESRVRESEIIALPLSNLPQNTKLDYIDRIIAVFQEEFLLSRDFPYQPKVMDRKYASDIHRNMIVVQDARKNYNLSTEDMLEILRVWFRSALKIDDKYHYAKMSITHLGTNFTEIMNIIKLGKPEHGKGLSGTQVISAAAAAAAAN